MSVFGKNVCAYDDEDLRHRIGYVQQKAVLFQGTVRSNLLWGDDSASDDDLRTALSTAQVLDIVADKGGLDAPVEQNGANFSGGAKAAAVCGACAGSQTANFGAGRLVLCTGLCNRGRHAKGHFGAAL